MNDRLKRILKSSTKAVCGITEREVSVPSHKVSSTIHKLKSTGHRVIGTSYGQSRFKKIWFIKHGGF